MVWLLTFSIIILKFIILLHLLIAHSFLMLVVFHWMDISQAVYPFTPWLSFEWFFVLSLTIFYEHSYISHYIGHTYKDIHSYFYWISTQEWNGWDKIFKESSLTLLFSVPYELASQLLQNAYWEFDRDWFKFIDQFGANRYPSDMESSNPWTHLFYKLEGRSPF